MSFKVAFQEALRRNGMTMEEAAVKFGVSYGTVARWKAGTRVPTGPVWQKMRNELPHFAELIDGKETAVA